MSSSGNTFFKTISLLIICTLLLFHQNGSGQNPEGKFRETFPNGRIKTKGHYHLGKKQRLWMHYDQDGKVVLKEKWKKGQLLWKAEYEDGKLIRLIDKDGNVRTKSKCGC